MKSVPLIVKLAKLLPPELAHSMALFYLQSGMSKIFHRPNNPSKSLEVNIARLNFKSPIGLAAGFDKNGIAISALNHLGMGFIEVGTVTPFAQKGNKAPRLFRLKEHRSLINRMGFNSDGHFKLLKNIERSYSTIPLGINISANRASSDRVHDFVLGVRRFTKCVDFITLNISSPNTEGLRSMHDKDKLESLLRKVKLESTQQFENSGKSVPIFLKVSPDIELESVQLICDIAIKYDVKAIIVSNTTKNRNNFKNLSNDSLIQEGGLSGSLLFDSSTKLLANFFEVLQGSIPLIGCGGVDDTSTAVKKLQAGAAAIQLYTGLVYNGFGLVEEINRGLSDYLEKHQISCISKLVGTDYKYWL